MSIKSEKRNAHRYDETTNCDSIGYSLLARRANKIGLLARRASEEYPQNATRYRASPELTTNHTKYTNKENANMEIVRGVA